MSELVRRVVAIWIRPPFDHLRVRSTELEDEGGGRGRQYATGGWLAWEAPSAGLDDLVGFRCAFYECLTARSDVLFELTDAVLCTDGPVRSLVGLSLAPEHRRGYGAPYDALNHGRVDIARLRIALAGRPLPRAADGRLVLAVDVSPWLRPDAITCPDRSFCHTYGRGKNSAQMIPGWPYSFVAALETGRSSWTAMLDAIRPEPGADLAALTTNQIRDVVQRLIDAGQWREGDPETW